MSTHPPPTDSAPPAAEQRFTWRQKFVIWLVASVAHLGIRLVGPTLRVSTSIEEGGPATGILAPAIYVFWHRCVFPATWHFRENGIAVMTSRSFDGEYIARVIEKFGFRAVRGSSSRGGVRALLGMHREIDQGRAVAFTIDGPRGPRYVAKPGPVLLARNTQIPIIPFHIAVEKAWVLNSWDALMIPKPFSRCLLRIGRLVHVPAHAHRETLSACHAEMQAGLDRIREFAEKNMPQQR